MRLCPQERRSSNRNRSEERPRRQHRRLPRIHEEIREEYSQLVHRRSGGTSSGGFLLAEHPFIVQDIIEVVTYINYSKKGSSDHQYGLPWEIEVHVITTLLSADRQASPTEPPERSCDPAIPQPGRVSCSRQSRCPDARHRPCRSRCSGSFTHFRTVFGMFLDEK